MIAVLLERRYFYWINKRVAEISSSADGSRLAAGVSGNIYISNNSGNSWIEVTSTGGGKQWRGIAMSSDGIKIIAAVWNGNIWTSTVNDNADVDDSVYVWTENTLTGVERNWENMAMSSDGKIVAAATYGGNIWISNDSGVGGLK